MNLSSRLDKLAEMVAKKAEAAGQGRQIVKAVRGTGVIENVEGWGDAMPMIPREVIEERAALSRLEVVENEPVVVDQAQGEADQPHRPDMPDQAYRPELVRITSKR